MLFSYEMLASTLTMDEWSIYYKVYAPPSTRPGNFHQELETLSLLIGSKNILKSWAATEKF